MKNQSNLSFLNTGSGKGFHEAMVIACIAKFGENNQGTRFGSWEPTNDIYANKLLDKFVGSTTPTYGFMSIRMFLRVLFAQELGNYYLTGIKNELFVKSLEENDKYHWYKGCGYNRILLSEIN